MADLLTQTSILIVSAPSGQGKSSTVKAGLFPFLHQQKAYTQEQISMLRPMEREHAKWDALRELDAGKAHIVLLDQFEELHNTRILFSQEPKYFVYSTLLLVFDNTQSL